MLYYPKYKKSGTEATISWDVAGYYLYLPALFIHKDLKKLAFAPKDRDKYQYTPSNNSFYQADNGNQVLKYSIGMSILYTPAFLIGHTITLISDYPSDGYSLPYQFALFLQGFLMVFIGLFYLRRVLLNYYADRITTATLIIMGLCTNLVEYGAITNAMSHNYLFAGYAILLYACIQLVKTNNLKYYIIAAITIGLMSLARPTEIISLLIPLGYIIANTKQNFLGFVKENVLKILLAILLIGIIGSIQLIYWHYVSGNIVEYSYQDQGFSWFSPHILDGLFSFRAGWLVYTPVMILSLIGFMHLYKSQSKWFGTSLVFSILFIYIAFAWDIWWYGGSLGQRTMIQIFPVLAIPLSALLARAINPVIKGSLLLFVCLCGYLNFWMVHHAHHGGLIKVGEMTKAYYLAIVGRNEVPKETAKLLDARYIHTDHILSEILLYNSNDTLCLNTNVQFTPTLNISVPVDAKFIRTYIDFTVNDIEWEKWRWTQLIMKYKGKSDITNMLRIQRLDNSLGNKSVFLDSKVPSGYQDLEVSIWHAESQKQLCIENIKTVVLK